MIGVAGCCWPICQGSAVAQAAVGSRASRAATSGVGALKRMCGAILAVAGVGACGALRSGDRPRPTLIA